MKVELEKALQQSLHGEVADSIVETIRIQMEQWGLSMPDVPPLVFDFGLGDVLNIGETEYWIANEIEEGYCGKYMFLLKGQTCPEHYHDMKHETFFIVKGKVRMTSDGTSWSMLPGDVYAVKPTIKHTFTAEEPSLILEISKPSLIADNVFSDKDTGYNR
jgi:quercetin dioxygenase-like cupin family protein